MIGLTIKEIAKRNHLSYGSARYFVRRLNEAGAIKPCGKKGRETLWTLTD